MTPAEIQILSQDPDWGDKHFVVARIYVRSDGNAYTNIEWIQKAIDKFPGQNPYALASEIMETGGDMWLGCNPQDNNQVSCTWQVKWIHDDDESHWEIVPPDSMTTKEQEEEIKRNMAATVANVSNT